MSRIEEMIKELCPKGVERVKLGDCCAFQRGTSITSTETIPGNIPVISGGLKPSYFHNKSNRTGDTITVAGSGASSGFVDYWTTPIWVADAFTVEPNELLNRRYVYFFLKNNQRQIYQFQKGAGVPHVHGRDLANLSIPLPPLSVQREIVSVLDSFTTLIDKMKQEVEMRKRQMEYYREKMMTPKDDWEIKSLGEIGNVRMCKRILKNQTSSNGPIPFYKIGTFGGIPDAFISNDLFCEYKTKYNFPKKGDILISAAGTIGRCVEYDGTPSYFQDSNIVWIENDESIVLNVYLKQFYHIAKWKIDDGGVVKRLYNESLRATPIPLPPLPVQRRIVATLDTFEAYITKMERLIALRQKQYEYYRERLLTFA